MPRRRVIAALLFPLLLPAAAPAVEGCKARIHKKTGEIEVSARNVVGAVFWGGLEYPANPLPGLAACQKGGKLKKCLLGDPGTPAAKRTPASCTLGLRDDVGTCQIHIRGCVADPVLSATVTEVVMSGNWDLGRSYGAVDLVKGGTGEFEVLFDRSISECSPSVTAQGVGHATACVHCGATDRHLLVRTYDTAGVSTDLSFYVNVHCH